MLARRGPVAVEDLQDGDLLSGNIVRQVRTLAPRERDVVDIIFANPEAEDGLHNFSHFFLGRQ